MNKNLLVALVVICGIIGGIHSAVKNRARANKIPENFDYGSWNGNSYRNDFFGFSFDKPESWHIADEADLSFVNELDESEESGFSQSKKAKKLLEIADITTAHLFLIMRYGIDEAIEQELEFNPTIALVAENISASNINMLRYAELSKKHLPSVIPGIVIQPATVKKIGGKTFVSLSSEFIAYGDKVKIENLFLSNKRFALCFALSWQEDSEKQELDEIMSSLKWD